MLGPLDIVVSVKAAILDQPRWTIAQMAAHLGMDQAQVFRAAKRAATSRLLVAEPVGRGYRPHRAALLEVLIHAVKYWFIPVRGRMTRGMPTAYAAPVMAGRIAASSDPVPVWPTADGSVRGESFEPLHRCVPFAASRDRRFYDAMALVDAIRGGRARERALAIPLLREALRGDGK